MADRRAVVIGGGISGVLCARELLLRGWDVTVLEAAHLGAGSSSRSAAGIRQQFSTPGTVHGMRYSVAFYRAFQAEVRDGTSPIVQHGYLFLFADAAAYAAAEERVAMQRACGLREVEAVPAPELQRRFPWVGASAIGGTFCPTDGFLLPHLVYSEGARRVAELGGRVVQHAPVTGATGRGERVGGVITPKGTFEADLFLDCTNAWTRRTARLLGAEDLAVDPLKRYLWFLKRNDGFPLETFAGMPLTISPGGVYCRPENEETLIVGKMHATDPEPDFAYEDQDRVQPGYSHAEGVEAHPYGVWAELAEHLPPIGEFDGFTATTSGYYATTPDHNPFFGFDPRRPDLIRLVGFSGHGAMFGPFTALVAAELADAGRDLDAVVAGGARVPLDAFRIGRAYHHGEALVI